LLGAAGPVERWCLDSFATAGGQSRALLNRERLHPLGAWYRVAMVYEGAVALARMTRAALPPAEFLKLP
jgi:hypothetical protein